MLPFSQNEGIIIALATPPGSGALAIIRLSGDECISLVNQFFTGNDLTDKQGYTIHYGNIKDEKNEVVDEVLVSIFRSPRSFTGEEMVEISCHGSNYIINEIIRLFLRNGAEMAKPGEFTMRAYMNGKLDLSQAESVGDLISSKTKFAHDIALKQLKGGFSSEIKNLREKLIHFSSLLELELDFSEEDVEFADRNDFIRLINEIQNVINRLIQSFKLGNVLKNGVPTVIIGRPNAGKSTLLNTLLNEERALVSEIAGTTRDTIEEELNINGIIFKLIDTAGIREAKDKIEIMGIEKTMTKIEQSSLIIYIYDSSAPDLNFVAEDLNSLKSNEVPVLMAANKSDLISDRNITLPKDHIQISAKSKTDVEQLKNHIFDTIINSSIDSSGLIITNERHLSLLIKTSKSLENVLEGLNNKLPGDLVAVDIRLANQTLGEITGTISSEDLLKNIFSSFCIGK
ncbi:MAG: tRNA uridine-5-carboxymethylaminomethyl(34) synthesis GTPase MnmE [Deltaproteobacteria bacterium]